MDIINDENRLRDLKEKQDAIRKEQWELRETYRKEFIQKAEEMSDERFWKGVDIFLEKIEDALHVMKDTNKYDDIYSAIKRAAHNFAKESSNNDKFLDFISFVRTYSIKTGEVYEPCFENITGCSDDVYGDFCDRLPLFGKEVFEEAINGKLKGEADNWTFKKQHELYVCGSLEEAVEDFLPSFITEMLDVLSLEIKKPAEEGKIKSW